METFIIFFVIFSLLTSTFALNEDCKTTNCNPGGPNIQFPFQVKSQEHQNSCSKPGFELDCENNSTIIHFPSFGNLVVKSISYETRKLDLLDPRSCVHGVFLNLNLSLTPFRYYYTVKDYTYLNCSARLSSNSFTEIPCLSGFGHHVYTVEPSLAFPFSCRAIKTIAIPFGYSSYLSDNSFGLGLTWGFLGRKDCEQKGGRRALQSKRLIEGTYIHIYKFHSFFNFVALFSTLILFLYLCLGKLISISLICTLIWLDSFRVFLGRIKGNRTELISKKLSLGT